MCRFKIQRVSLPGADPTMTLALVVNGVIVAIGDHPMALICFAATLTQEEGVTQ